jgi:hypothetical protein
LTISPDWIQAVAAVLTFGAAGLAVWATFRAPKLAAEFAERLRADAQVDDEKRRMKLFVFTTLMQYRAAILNPNCVAALNLIDVAFIDDTKTREAWKDFCHATDPKNNLTQSITERYIQILDKMAQGLGLSSQISIFDVRACYYPEGMGKMDHAALLEAEDKIQRFSPSAIAGPV